MATIKEEKLSYNGNAFTRLLTYVRPYWKTMVLCTALVLAVTALNLYRPILIGDVIWVVGEEEHIRTLLKNIQ